MTIRETKADGTVYEIAIFSNEKGKFQLVNLTKEKICPCEFDSRKDAFLDLAGYIAEGKIKGLEILSF